MVSATLLQGSRLLWYPRYRTDQKICSRIISCLTIGNSLNQPALPFRKWIAVIPEINERLITSILPPSFLFRYSQTPQTSTAAVSSKIVCHPSWLSRQREKSRVGSFAGLQRSFWSVKRRRKTTRRRKRSRIMAASQTDSRHRILSTRGRVAAPIHSYSLFLSDWLSLSHTGYTAPQHSNRLTQSVSWCHLVAVDTKASLPQKKQYTQATHFLTQWFIHLDCKPTKIDSKRKDTHASNLHLLHTMPTAVCVSAQKGCPVGQRQLSAPWTALTLQGATTALYFPPKWLASWPQRVHTRMHCGTRGEYRLQYTVHTCVQFLDWYVNYCDCHCCP